MLNTLLLQDVLLAAEEAGLEGERASRARAAALGRVHAGAEPQPGALQEDQGKPEEPGLDSRSVWRRLPAVHKKPTTVLGPNFFLVFANT